MRMTFSWIPTVKGLKNSRGTPLEMFLGKVFLLCNFIEITLRHGRSPVNLLHIFRTLFSKNISRGLLLFYIKTLLEKLRGCIKTNGQSLLV